MIIEAPMVMSAEEIELERDKLKVEERRISLAEEVQRREVALKEKQHGESSISGAQATIAGAILALLSGWIGATISSSSSEAVSETNAASALEIERTKVQGNLDLELTKQTTAEKLARLEFETSLILGAIEESSREEAIRNLRFFLAAGFISDPSGKIASLQDDQLPSKAGPSPDDIIKAFDATVKIQFLGNNNNVYCTAVSIDSKHLLTAGYCHSNISGTQASTVAQYSDEGALHNLSLVTMAANNGIALLKLDSGAKFSTSIDWKLVREPVLGEPIYMATWVPGTDRRSLRTCTVIELSHEEHSFSHDCTTGKGSAGSLMISAIDEAPLGIHNRASRNANKAFAAQLTSISAEISNLIGIDAD